MLFVGGLYKDLPSGLSESGSVMVDGGLVSEAGINAKIECLHTALL